MFRPAANVVSEEQVQDRPSPAMEEEPRQQLSDSSASVSVSSEAAVPQGGNGEPPAVTRAGAAGSNGESDVLRYDPQSGPGDVAGMEDSSAAPAPISAASVSARERADSAAEETTATSTAVQAEGGREGSTTNTGAGAGGAPPGGSTVDEAAGLRRRRWLLTASAAGERKDRRRK